MPQVAEHLAVGALGGSDAHGLAVPLQDVAQAVFHACLPGGDSLEGLHPLAGHCFVAAIVAGGNAALAILAGRPQGLEGFLAGAFAGHDFLGALGKLYRLLGGVGVFGLLGGLWGWGRRGWRLHPRRGNGRRGGAATATGGVALAPDASALWVMGHPPLAPAANEGRADALVAGLFTDRDGVHSWRSPCQRLVNTQKNSGVDRALASEFSGSLLAGGWSQQRYLMSLRDLVALLHILGSAKRLKVGEVIGSLTLHRIS